MKHVVIIDDDKNILTTLKIHLEGLGFGVRTAATGAEGLRLVKKHVPHIVFLDLKLPDQDGLQVLDAIERTGIETDVIVITAFATIDTAVTAIKMGAFDYVSKPFTPAQISHLIGMIEKVRSMEAEIRVLKGIFQEGDLITRSHSMHKILEIARQVAETNATVSISGESGTGKEVLARLIHAWSPRTEKPFITVDCTVLQENLLESSLFGHKKGAFTGAFQDKIGKLKMADEGTVLFDEISEMPSSIQAKFLRFLQHKEFERLGDPTNIRVDVRVIAATNKNLQELVHNGEFRQDLFFRLNVVEFDLPPLRERPEDIEILAVHYLKRFSRVHNKPVLDISPEVIRAFQYYSWPGNIRELVNVIERGTIFCQGKQLTLSNIPSHIAQCKNHPSVQGERRNLSDVEKHHIQQVLADTASIDEAARILGIDPATLWRKRKKYHID